MQGGELIAYEIQGESMMRKGKRGQSRCSNHARIFNIGADENRSCERLQPSVKSVLACTKVDEMFLAKGTSLSSRHGRIGRGKESKKSSLESNRIDKIPWRLRM